MCENKERRKRTLWTTETFGEYVKSQTNGEYVLRSEYKKAQEKVFIEHTVCGTVYDVTPNSFINGSRCSECFGKHRKTTEQFKQEVFEMYGDEYEVVGEYINSSTKLEMKHNCGLIYPVSPANFLNGKRCPRCMRRLVDETNCLVTTHPELVKEWHFVKNGDKTPYNILSGHKEDVWWICPEGHEYEAKPYHRTSKSGQTGCPYCNGTNKLLYEDSLEYKSPLIAKEWHPTKNGDLKPSEVFNSSNKEVWWLCENGHEWQQRISTRTRESAIAECPCCRGLKLTLENCLATTHPEIAKRWHPTKNGDLTPYDIRRYSIKKVWWICDEGHEHETRVCDKNDSCPICSSQILHNDNCLATVNPKLAMEWHPTKNGDLTPYDVMGFSLRAVWWLCPDCGHEWEAFISNRGNKGSGCPHCNLFVSKGERRVQECLLKHGLNIDTQYREPNCKNILPLPFDVAVFDEDGILKCLVEYDGEGHFYPIGIYGGEEEFESRKQNDEIKDKYCEDNGIILIRIPYWLLNHIDEVLTYWLKYYKII